MICCLPVSLPSAADGAFGEGHMTKGRNPVAMPRDPAERTIGFAASLPRQSQKTYLVQSGRLLA